jgi:hypothetical protein
MATKEKVLIDPSEQEIKLTFHNYKLLKHEEFNLQGSHIYFVKGPNETGKSSILFALRAAMEIKDDTHQKVSIGESEGLNEFSIPGPDGRMYNVVYEFTDATTKFVIFDEDGNKISKITEMRNIFKYNHVDATSFIAWSNTAEGRRKQKDYILQLLPSGSYIKFKDLEQEEDRQFKLRTQKNKDLESATQLQNEFILTEEEKVIQRNLEPAQKQLKLREEEYNTVLNSTNELELAVDKVKILQNKNSVLTEDINDINNEIEKLQRRLQDKTDELKRSLKLFEEVNNSYNMLLESKLDNESKKEKLRLSVENGREYVNRSKSLNEKLAKFATFKEKSDTLFTECADLTQAIESIREQKEKIITEGKFPVENLSFDQEGYLTINGLRFDEHQTCESDTILIVAQLLCKMNISPIQILGDASLLDYNKLDKLYDIAEANGKIMFVDEIDRTLDKLVIVGYEKKDKTSKKAPTTKTKNIIKDIKKETEKINEDLKKDNDPLKPLF